MVLVCIARIDCIVSTAGEFSLEPRIFSFLCYFRNGGMTIAFL